MIRGRLCCVEGALFVISREHIRSYLDEVKAAVERDKYTIARNDNRLDNIKLFEKYLLTEHRAKEILLSLAVEDFSEILMNEHKGFEHERLYVFGKDVELSERYGNTMVTVSLYIKFNKLENSYVIVVSLHEQKYPMTYYFK